MEPSGLKRRRLSEHKTITKHPIAAIEKRVIDSEAFARLPSSAVVTLLLMARNLDKGKNGRIFVSQEDAEKHGIEKKTFYRHLKILAASGFIYQTSRGGHGKCATYALTWLPLTKDTQGLHLGAFFPFAYLNEDIGLQNWKKRMGKMSISEGQKSPQPSNLGDKKPPSLGDKNPHIEVIPITGAETSPIPDLLRPFNTAWIRSEVARLAGRGLAARQCFQIPQGVTLQ